MDEEISLADDVSLFEGYAMNVNNNEARYHAALKLLIDEDDRERRRLIVEEVLGIKINKRKSHKVDESSSEPVVIKRRRVENPDMTQQQQCDVCHTVRTLAGFHKCVHKTTKVGVMTYHYLSNVCNVCTLKHARDS